MRDKQLELMVPNKQTNKRTDKQIDIHTHTNTQKQDKDPISWATQARFLYQFIKQNVLSLVQITPFFCNERV